MRNGKWILWAGAALLAAAAALYVVAILNYGRRAAASRLLVDAVRADDVAGAERALAAAPDLEVVCHPTWGPGLTAADVHDDGLTPLGIAAARGDLPMVRILLAKGARAAPPGRDNNQALFEAARRGNPDIVLALLERGAPVDGTRGMGVTPLMIAAQAGNVEVTKLLLAHGADPRHRDRRGLDIFDFAFGPRMDANHATIFRMLKRAMGSCK
jgi:hypothetical protein